VTNFFSPHAQGKIAIFLVAVGKGRKTPHYPFGMISSNSTRNGLPFPQFPQKSL
jgi:hypothetical protein